MTHSLTLIRPDDWHLHLRDGSITGIVLGDTARRFGRAIVMPNLTPPVTTTEMAHQYRSRILEHLTGDRNFEPLMTLYLTDATEPGEIDRAAASPHVHAVKYYPAGATTHSESGVTSLANVYPVIERMQELGVPLLVHGEVTDAHVDIFDREKVFIDSVLGPLTELFPGLRLVFEHITTKEAVEFVTGARSGVAATITPQHAMLGRNALLSGGVRPHNYCLPVLKREEHREAVLDAAVSGNARFFLGTDSAPHSTGSKESACGCAGVYSAPAAIELYAEMFERAGRLDRLENFASVFGAEFYGLARNSGTLTLVKENWTVPEKLGCGDLSLTPFMAGQTISWRLLTN